LEEWKDDFLGLWMFSGDALQGFSSTLGSLGFQKVGYVKESF
jgi:hypothetical protein